MDTMSTERPPSQAITLFSDYETLSESQLQLVSSVLQKQGFKDGKVVVNPVGQKGDNFVANVKRFVYEKSDGSFFKIIGKIAPVAQELRFMLHTDLLFTNETRMYEDVLPKFKDLQNLAGAPVHERIRFPHCYGTLTEAPYELILLEDLGESSFEMLDRFQPLPIDAIRVTLKDLAIYHSLSYALKTAEPETYESFTSKQKNFWTLIDADPNTKTLFEATENDLILLMDSEKYKKVISGSISQITVRVKKIESYEKKSKYSVIQQGDCWSNNILFRLEDGKVVENIMIDYQLSKESNPAADLLYFILNCTDHETRIKHYHEWIDYYHEILDASLANHGLKSKHVFPRDQLDADLRRYGRIMVGQSIFLATMLIRESKDAVDFKEMADEATDADNLFDDVLSQMRASSLNKTTALKLKQRIIGIIDSAEQLGLI